MTGQWLRSQLATPAFGAVRVRGVDADASDDYFMTVNDFLTPSSLFLGTVGTAAQEKLKGLPEFFNTEGLAISQHEAVSKDGTKIPYFQVSRKERSDKWQKSHTALRLWRLQRVSVAVLQRHSRRGLA